MERLAVMNVDSAMHFSLPLFLLLSAATGIGAVVKESDQRPRRRLTLFFGGAVYGSVVSWLYFLEVLGIGTAALLLLPLTWFPVSIAFEDQWKRLLIVSLLGSAAMFAALADHFQYRLGNWCFNSGVAFDLFIVEPWHPVAARVGIVLSLLGAAGVAWKYPGVKAE